MNSTTTGSEAHHPLAELYTALGHRIYSTAGTLWIDIGRFSLTSVPYATPVQVFQEDIDQLLRQARRPLAVFPTTLSTGIRSGAYWVRDREFGPHSLQKQFRQHVRRGSQTCVVRPIDWETLRREGLNCNIDSMRRRHMVDSSTTHQAGWNRVCDAAARVAGLEAFGCFFEGSLVAFLISWIDGSVCEGLLMHRDRRGDPVRASHVLYYEFTRIMCQRDELTGVTLGRHWIPPFPSLDQFKRHAGYQVEPLQVVAVVHPVVRPLLTHSLIRGLMRKLRQWGGPRLAVLDNVAVLDAAAATQLPRR